MLVVSLAADPELMKYVGAMDLEACALPKGSKYDRSFSDGILEAGGAVVNTAGEL